jgi:hypothetical protein
MEGPRMQQWHKGLRPETAATRQNEKDYLSRKQPLYLKKNRATVIGIRGLSSRHLSHLGRRGPSYRTLKKTLELEIEKQALGISSGAAWDERVEVAVVVFTAEEPSHKSDVMSRQLWKEADWQCDRLGHC